MKLNKIEFALVNNPIRAFIQKNYESKMFSTAEFLEGLSAAGFELHGFSEYYPLMLLKHFSSVAKKPALHNESPQLGSLGTP